MTAQVARGGEARALGASQPGRRLLPRAPRATQRPRSRHEGVTNQAVLDKLLGHSSAANANGLTPRGGRARAGAGGRITQRRGRADDSSPALVPAAPCMTIPGRRGLRRSCLTLSGFRAGGTHPWHRHFRLGTRSSSEAGEDAAAAEIPPECRHAANRSHAFLARSIATRRSGC